MKKLLFCVLCLCIFGCGSAPVEEATSQQSQAAVTYNTATNGVSPLLPNQQTHLCHPVNVTGSGAHSQSNIVSGNVPECGGSAFVGTGGHSSAFPNSCVSPASARQGSMSITTRCQPLSDFGPVTAGFTDFNHIWNPTGSLEAVAAGIQMLPKAPTSTTANVCYLSGFGSMSVGNEYAWLAYSATHAWVNAQGFKGLSVQGRCQRLGRPGGVVDTMEASTGVFAGGPLTSNRICLVTQVNGSLDDGSFNLSDSWGSWGLSVSGNVTYAKAECYVKPN